MEQPQSDVSVGLIEQVDEDELEEFVALIVQELDRRVPVVVPSSRSQITSGAGRTCKGRRSVHS